MISMPDMPNIDLDGIMKHLTTTGKRTRQLWLMPDSMAFIARGRARVKGVQRQGGAR
jgi:hypothetical protein